MNLIFVNIRMKLRVGLLQLFETVVQAIHNSLNIIEEHYKNLDGRDNIVELIAGQS